MSPLALLPISTRPLCARLGARHANSSLIGLVTPCAHTPNTSGLQQSRVSTCVAHPKMYREVFSSPSPARVVSCNAAGKDSGMSNSDNWMEVKVRARIVKDSRDLSESQIMFSRPSYSSTSSHPSYRRLARRLITFKSPRVPLGLQSFL